MRMKITGVILMYLFLLAVLYYILLISFPKISELVLFNIDATKLSGKIHLMIILVQAILSKLLLFIPFCDKNIFYFRIVNVGYI